MILAISGFTIGIIFLYFYGKGGEQSWIKPQEQEIENEQNFKDDKNNQINDNLNDKQLQELRQRRQKVLSKMSKSEQEIFLNYIDEKKKNLGKSKDDEKSILSVILNIVYLICLGIIFYHATNFIDFKSQVNGEL